MRKLKLQIQMTIDGFVAGPNGKNDWMFNSGTMEVLVFKTNVTSKKKVSKVMAGNKTYLALFPGAAHGFNLVPIKIAEVANNMYFDWLKNLIANSN